jgi:hypothetical protein
MTVSSDLAELERMAAASSPESDGSLAALTTIPSLFAYIATCARSEDRDEADDCETFARYAGLTPDEVRHCAGTLRRLGYVVASDRLFQIAGRRRRDLRPLK